MRSFLSPSHPPSVIFLSLIQSISLSLLLHLAEYNYHESDVVPSRLILRLGCVPANTQRIVITFSVHDFGHRRNKSFFRILLQFSVEKFHAPKLHTFSYAMCGPL